MPFTIEQFFEVFRQYNQTVWPAQLLAVRPVPYVVFVAPVLWALIGSYAAAALDMPQDYGLLAAVLLALLGLRPQGFPRQSRA